MTKLFLFVLFIYATISIRTHNFMTPGKNKFNRSYEEVCLHYNGIICKKVNVGVVEAGKKCCTRKSPGEGP